MVDSERGRRQRRRRSPVISPVLRPALWSALLGAIAATVLANPVQADPSLPTSVPDTGSRPAYTGQLQLPGGTPVPGLPGSVPGLPGTVPGLPTGNIGTGPLAAQIYAAEAQVGQLRDQLLLLRQRRTDAEAQRATAERDLANARDALARAQEGADAAAAGAFKAAAALPPGEFANDLHELSRFSRIIRGEKAEGGTTAAQGELSRTRTGEQAAGQAMISAESRLAGVRAEYTAGDTALRGAEKALDKLRRDNAAQLVEIERQQEAAEQRLGAGYLGDETANGLAAHPTALKALAYARAQLGDPYLWAAEGPDRFDCSGLIYAAYRSAGYYGLPRVSRDQYYATRSRTVSRTALLPGDLVFFASGTSWTTIHHMGMYVGGGKMIHSPTTGDVVKISTVRWSRLYAATRVIGAVPAPASTPSPTPTPTKPPTPTPTPPASPSPTPKPTSPSPSPTPKPTSPSPTPSTSTSPSATPTGSASPTATPDASTSASPSPSRSTTSSPTATTGSVAPTTAASSSDPVGSTSATASASTGS
ncbi:C40 family peptidase [Micromonospora peucetia]|uniref:C40 family peptidase n=1 Tax=Micromonospora peucetia TaxID=47871 RepID=A0ABZ1EKA8_9ACTN|nr:C40 family peptidase [Micromonospora peucetia]WSA34652.1 C40 family peptidase [Micromonospora peucetia]